MINAQIKIDSESARRLDAHMKTMRDQLGMTTEKALARMATYVAGAAAASCRVSPKKRRVVSNPDARAKTDGRLAKYGVMRFDQHGNEEFVPIYRTGEFGKIRFLNKKTGEYITIDPITGQRVKMMVSLGNNPEMETPGIMQSPKRKIGRSGLARDSWRWMSRRTLKGGRGQVRDVPAAAEVHWSVSRNVIAITLRNNLRYMDKALRNGRQTIDTIGQRAADKLRNAIEANVKKLAAKGAA